MGRGEEATVPGKNKFRLAMTLAIVVPMLAGAVIINQFEHGSKLQEEAVKSNFFVSTETLSHSLSKLFFAHYHSVQALAKNPDLRSNRSDKIQFVLNEFKSIIPVIDYAVMSDVNGTILATSNIDADYGKLADLPDQLSQSVSESRWFQELIAERFTENIDKGIFYSYAGKVHYDTTAEALYGKPRLGHYYATVVEDEFGDHVGYIAVFYNTAWIQRELAELVSGLSTSGKKDVSAAIYNKDNELIAQYPYLESTSYLSPLKLESNQVFEDVSTGCKATSIADGGSGEGSRLYAYQPINTEMFLSDHMGWKILLSTDATHAMKEINSARKKTFLLIGTVVILCIVLLVINILSKYKLEVFNLQLESLVAERTKALRTKTEDINSMLTHIKQGIFTIVNERRIHFEHSSYLSEILEEGEIGGQDISDLVLKRTTLSSDIQDQVIQSLNCIIGYDQISYIANEHNLIQECELITEDGAKKYLEIEWNPICDGDDVTVKVLVAIRDVTEIKALQKVSDEQKKRMEIISQVLNIEARSFKKLMDSFEAMLNESRMILHRNIDHSDHAIERIFINLHTMKGSSRSKGLQLLSAVIHEAESKYSALKQRTMEWNHQGLIQDLDLVTSQLNEYKRVNSEVLKRDAHSSSVALSPEKVMKNIDLALKAVEDSDLLLIKKHISQLKSAVVKPHSFQSLVHSIESGLPEISKSLDKPIPEIHLEAPDSPLEEWAYDVIDKFIPHLVINSFDHGIEPKEARLAAGKPEQGRINIVAFLDEENYKIEIFDDGRGLNLGRLKEKYHTHAKKDEELSSLIFSSGVSIVENVTELSGRGIGLDAVKYFVESVGGSIDPVFTGPADDEQFRPFKLVISIPRTKPQSRQAS